MPQEFTIVPIEIALPNDGGELDDRRQWLATLDLDEVDLGGERWVTPDLERPLVIMQGHPRYNARYVSDRLGTNR